MHFSCDNSDKWLSIEACDEIPAAQGIWGHNDHFINSNNIADKNWNIVIVWFFGLPGVRKNIHENERMPLTALKGSNHHRHVWNSLRYVATLENDFFKNSEFHF